MFPFRPHKIKNIFRVEKLGQNDSRRGWVRIHKEDRDGIDRKTICKIEVEEKGKKTYRQIYGCNPREVIQMGLETRAELGVDIGKKYLFILSKANPWQIFVFYWKHPNIGISLSVKIFTCSVLLAVILSSVNFATTKWLGYRIVAQLTSQNDKHQLEQTEDFCLPACTQEDVIIKHFAYALKYNEEHEQAAWVAYELTAKRVKGTCERTDDFRPDPAVKTGSAELSDYKGSGYDRGHLAPAADMKWSATAMSESFYMSNMSPQVPGFNRGIWKKLEEQVRAWATDNEEIYVVTGPVLSEGLPAIGSNEVAVPDYFYKVVLDYKEPEFKGIGFVLQNESSKEPLVTYAVTIDSVEVITGIDFFPAMEDSMEDVIEATMEIDKWGFKIEK